MLVLTFLLILTHEEVKCAALLLVCLFACSTLNACSNFPTDIYAWRSQVCCTAAFLPACLLICYLHAQTSMLVQTFLLILTHGEVKCAACMPDFLHICCLLVCQHNCCLLTHLLFACTPVCLLVSCLLAPMLQRADSCSYFNASISDCFIPHRNQSGTRIKIRILFFSFIKEQSSHAGGESS